MKRTYTKKFKIKTCQQVRKDGIKPSVAAEKLGINAVMLYRRMEEYRLNGVNAFIGKGRLLHSN